MFVTQRVESAEDVLQQLHHVGRGHVGRVRGKAHDVDEHQGGVVEVITGDVFAADHAVGYGLRQRAVEQSAFFVALAHCSVHRPLGLHHRELLRCFLPADLFIDAVVFVVVFDVGRKVVAFLG